jgi:hypothetical protein
MALAEDQRMVNERDAGMEGVEARGRKLCEV